MSNDCAFKHCKTAVSCLISLWGFALDLTHAARSCECHELSRSVLLWLMLERDLEEMTQVLKMKPMPSAAPLSALIQHLLLPHFLLLSFLCLCPPLFFLPHLSFHISSCFSVFSPPLFCLSFPLSPPPQPSSSIHDACFFPPWWLVVKEGSLSLSPPPQHMFLL